MQNLDEPLEEESDKVFFEHFLSCYSAFHHGRDDYREELDLLKENFMRIYDVDDQVGVELVRTNLLNCTYRYFFHLSEHQAQNLVLGLKVKRAK